MGSRSSHSGSGSGGRGSDDKANLLAGLEPFAGLRDPNHRWLPPLVLSALCALLLAACGGMVLSGLVFGGAVQVWKPCLGQSFVLFASLLAFPYIYMHIWASRKSYALTRSHVFQHPVHSWSIVIVRMDFLAWLAALITVSIAVARPTGPVMHLQVDLFICVLAFLAILIALCAIEKAADPFILPGITPVISILTRTNTLAIADKLDASVSQRASAEQRRDRPILPRGPRPLGSTRIGTRASGVPTSAPDHAPLPPPPGEPGRRSMCHDPGVPGNRQASWSSQHQAAHVHQQQEPALHYQHQHHPHHQQHQQHHQQHQQHQQTHQPPPPVHHRASMTPMTPSDWRHDWSALAGEAGMRRDLGRGSVASSLAGSWRSPTNPQPHPHHHPHAPLPLRPSVPYGGWATPAPTSQPSLPLPPPPPTSLPPPPPLPPPPLQMARTSVGVGGGDVGVGGVGRRSGYAPQLGAPMTPAFGRGTGGGGGGGTGGSGGVSGMPRLPAMPEEEGGGGYRSAAGLPTVATYGKRDGIVGPPGLGLHLRPPLAPPEPPGSEPTVSRVKIPGAYVEDCNDD